MKAKENTNRRILARYNNDVIAYKDIQEASDDTLLEIWQIRRAIQRKAMLNGIVFSWLTEDLRGKHSNKYAKPILQISKEGEIIAEYNSAYQANQETGIGNIYKCLNGYLKSAGGFIWKYKTI